MVIFFQLTFVNRNLPNKTCKCTSTFANNEVCLDLKIPNLCLDLKLDGKKGVKKWNIDTNRNWKKVMGYWSRQPQCKLHRRVLWVKSWSNRNKQILNLPTLRLPEGAGVTNLAHYSIWNLNVTMSKFHKVNSYLGYSKFLRGPQKRFNVKSNT